MKKIFKIISIVSIFVLIFSLSGCEKYSTLPSPEMPVKVTETVSEEFTRYRKIDGEIYKEYIITCVSSENCSSCRIELRKV